MDLQLREYLISVYNATPEWQHDQLTWFHQVYFPTAEVYVSASNATFNYLRDEYDTTPPALEDVRDHTGKIDTRYKYKFICSKKKQEQVMKTHPMTFNSDSICGIYIMDLDADDYNDIAQFHHIVVPIDSHLLENPMLYDSPDHDKWMRGECYSWITPSTQECRLWLQLNPPITGESYNEYRKRIKMDLTQYYLPSTYKLMVTCMYPLIIK